MPCAGQCRYDVWVQTLWFHQRSELYLYCLCVPPWEMDDEGIQLSSEQLIPSQVLQVFVADRPVPRVGAITGSAALAAGKVWAKMRSFRTAPYLAWPSSLSTAP